MKTEIEQWEVVQGTNNFLIKSASRYIARTCGDSLANEEEAKLLAAAPDLLDALRTLWAWVDDLGKSNPGYLGKLCLQDYGQMNEAFLKTEQVLFKTKDL